MTTERGETARRGGRLIPWRDVEIRDDGGEPIDVDFVEQIRILAEYRAKHAIAQSIDWTGFPDEYAVDGATYIHMACRTIVRLGGFIGATPWGWTDPEWELAVIAAIEAGDCPKCDHDDIRAAGTRRELIGSDEHDED